MHTRDVPDRFPGREQLWPDEEWLNPGDSVIVAPGGRIVAGPLREEHGILIATIDPGRATPEHRTLDVAGHYARNDVFQLTVDRRPLEPITYQDEGRTAQSG